MNFRNEGFKFFRFAYGISQCSEIFVFHGHKNLSPTVQQLRVVVPDIADVFGDLEVLQLICWERSPSHFVDWFLARNLVAEIGGLCATTTNQGGAGIDEGLISSAFSTLQSKVK